MISNLTGLLHRWNELRPTAKLFTVICLIAAPMVGLASVMSGMLGNSKPVFLLALPLGLTLLFALVIQSHGVLLFIILTRAGLDPFLESTKIPFLGTSMGLGGILNGLLIFLAILYLRAVGFSTVSRYARWAYPFALTLLFGTIISPAPGEALKFTLGIATYAAAFSLGAALAKRKGAEYTLRLIFLSSIPPLLISGVMLITGWRFYAETNLTGELIEASGRFAGTFSHPNIMAFFLTNTVAVSLYLISKESRKPYALAILAALLFSLALIILSKTRAAWAAVSVMLLLHAIFFNRKWLPYLAACGAAVFFSPAIQERLSDLADERTYLIYTSLNSYEWRKQLWFDAINSMSWKVWVWGAGIRSFYVDSIAFFKLSGGHPFGAHSTYVQLLYESGVIGLILGLAPLTAAAYALIKSWPRFKDSAFLGLCLIVVYAVVSYSDNILSYLVYNVYFWMALGAALISADTETASLFRRTPDHKMANHKLP